MTPRRSWSSGATGTSASRSTAPTPLSRHSRCRSRANPSDTSIIEVAPSRARICPSPTRARGRNSARNSSLPHSVPTAPATEDGTAWASRNPPAAAPRAPVTTRRSPGRAPDLRTAVPRATVPATATDTTMRSDRDTSPPTIDMAYSAVASSIPPYRSTTQGGSMSVGTASETTPYRGLPPMAATSLTLTETALYPRSRGEVVSGSKCTDSTRMSAVRMPRCGPISTRAASSPGPRTTPGASVASSRRSSSTNSSSVNPPRVASRPSSTISPISWPFTIIRGYRTLQKGAKDGGHEHHRSGGRVGPVLGRGGPGGPARGGQDDPRHQQAGGPGHHHRREGRPDRRLSDPRPPVLHGRAVEIGDSPPASVYASVESIAPLTDPPR